jgi:hypothetical protein
MRILTEDIRAHIERQRNFVPSEKYEGRVLLFLDFDGVLHNYTNGYTGTDQFSNRHFVEDILRRHQNISVVVSSSWAKSIELGLLMKFFSEDVRSRFVGSIRFHTDSRREDVLKYLQTRGETDTLWVAVDDMAFYEDSDPIVWTNHRTGLTETTALTLERALTSPIEYKDFQCIA